MVYQLFNIRVFPKLSLTLVYEMSGNFSDLNEVIFLLKYNDYNVFDFNDYSMELLNSNPPWWGIIISKPWN